MSEVLRARMRECLTAYQVGCGTLLDVDELAAELLESVLPGNDNDCMDEPLFRALICEWGVCTNCYGGDCAFATWRVLGREEDQQGEPFEPEGCRGLGNRSEAGCFAANLRSQTAYVFQVQ